MADIKDVNYLLEEVIQIMDSLNIVNMQADLNKLINSSQSSSFWSDKTEAQATMKHISKLQDKIEPWVELKDSLKELSDLSKLNDKSLQKEINQAYTDLKKHFDALKNNLRFQGKYDDHDVILSIYAGAGGTDAQDWTQMLMRMYQRWADKKKLNFKTLEQSFGDEAGLKSASYEITGEPFLYGKLKGESGVHRLVRLSPFNADNLRQTSFAKVDILPLVDSPKEVDIDPKELKTEVFRSGGHGGQSVNTTDSAVRLTYLPTNLSVTIQNERSQLQNKETALKIIKSRLLQQQIEQHKSKISELKGKPQSAEWGNQIRNYILHPYNLVKDVRSGFESTDTQAILDGHIEPIIEAYQKHTITS